jgi:hypothetical protein
MFQFYVPGVRSLNQLFGNKPVGWIIHESIVEHEIQVLVYHRESSDQLDHVYIW